MSMFTWSPPDTTYTYTSLYADHVLSDFEVLCRHRPPLIEKYVPNIPNAVRLDKNTTYFQKTGQYAFITDEALENLEIMLEKCEL